MPIVYEAVLPATASGLRTAIEVDSGSELSEHGDDCEVGLGEIVSFTCEDGWRASVTLEDLVTFVGGDEVPDSFRVEEFDAM